MNQHQFADELEAWESNMLATFECTVETVTMRRVQLQMLVQDFGLAQGSYAAFSSMMKECQDGINAQKLGQREVVRRLVQLRDEDNDALIFQVRRDAHERYLESEAFIQRLKQRITKIQQAVNLLFWLESKAIYDKDNN